MDARALDYDDTVGNPFATMLRDRLAAGQVAGDGGDVLDYWSSGVGPRYLICRDEAFAYVGGDEEAGEALLEGRVGMREIPKDLRAERAELERAAWIGERSAVLATKNAEWFQPLGLADIDL